MKILISLLIIIFLIFLVVLFMAILIKSNALEKRVGIEYRRDVKFFVTKPSINWKKFFNYIKDIPKKTVNSFNSIKTLLKETEQQFRRTREFTPPSPSKEEGQFK